MVNRFMPANNMMYKKSRVLPRGAAVEGPPELGPLSGAAPEGAMAVVPLSLSSGTASAQVLTIHVQ